jgi:BirA family biotin operon repressor/biotin-[acetyl-CoA-carboxylase] ligase
VNPSSGRPVETLGADEIRQLMSAASLQLLDQITILTETDSSNSALKRLPLEQQHAHAVLADCQTGGRGRRQRSWYSPPGCNVYLSLGWRFDNSQGGLSTLPLMTAVCICRALAHTGSAGYGIKWPNDILVGDAKLAGILVEVQAGGSGAAHAVIGVGVNVFMPAEGTMGFEAGAAIDRPWTDIAAQIPDGATDLSRNRVAALLLENLVNGITEFETGGFQPFEAEWRKMDLLEGRRVSIQNNGKSTTGVARGIDTDGGLILEIASHQGTADRQVFHAGEAHIAEIGELQLDS